MTNKLLTLIALVTVASVNAGESWQTRLSDLGNRAGSFIDNNRETLQAGAQKLMDGAKAMRGAAESRMVGVNGGGVQDRYELVRAVGLGAAEGDLSFEPISAQYQEYCKGARCVLRKSVTGTLAAENYNDKRTDYVGTSKENGNNGNKLGIILANVSADIGMPVAGNNEVSIMPVEENEVSTMPVENDMATMPARLYNALVR